MTTTHTKHRNLAKKQRAFTLIELLLVIGIIAILMAIVILAVNPRLQFSKAEDARRNVQAREIKNALMQYQVDNGYVPNGVTTTPTPICAYRAPSASGCIVLDTLIDENYLVTFTPDIAEVDSNRLGYSVAQVTTGQVVVTPVHLSTATAAASAPSAPVAVPVTGVGFYYKDSVFSEGGTNIQAAIDTTKVPVRASSSAQTGAFINISNYVFGINGLVLEIPGLTSSTLTASDFIFRVGTTGSPSSWAAAPTPSLITAIPNDDRVVIEWANNAIQNTWLQVIVLDTPNTGLIQRDVLYFGSVRFEIDGIAPYRITSLDVGATAGAISPTLVGLASVHDVDKDGVVTTTDRSFVQSRVSSTVILTNIVFPLAGSLGEG